jgi:hypothetical protein
MIERKRTSELEQDQLEKRLYFWNSSQAAEQALSD